MFSTGGGNLKKIQGGVGIEEHVTGLETQHWRRAEKLGIDAFRAERAIQRKLPMTMQEENQVEILCNMVATTVPALVSSTSLAFEKLLGFMDSQRWHYYPSCGRTQELILPNDLGNVAGAEVYKDV